MHFLLIKSNKKNKNIFERFYWNLMAFFSHFSKDHEIEVNMKYRNIGR